MNDRLASFRGRLSGGGWQKVLSCGVKAINILEAQGVPVLMLRQIGFGRD
jgi:hypothetical protein